MIFVPIRKKYKFLCFAGLFLTCCLLLLLPVSGQAREASFYQKGLTSGESRLLFDMQKMMNQGEFQQSLEQFDKFRRSHSQPLPPLLGFVAANLNFQLGNYQEAVKLYRRVVEKAPEFNQAYENFGLALLRVENYPEACRVFLKASEMLPEKRGSLRYKAAVAALYADNLKQAYVLLQAIISDLSPAAAPPAAWLKALVRVCWQLSEPRKAMAAALRLVDLYPEEIANWRLYAQVASAAGDYRKALSAYAVLETSGKFTAAERKQVVALYQQLGLFSEAARELEEIYRETEPERQDLERLLALYRRSCETEKALQTLNRLQKLYPDAMNPFTRAEILYAAGRYREALVIFLSLDKIKEKDGRQFILAGYCAWNLDDFPAAAKAWQKAAQYSAWQNQARKLLQSLEPWLNDKDQVTDER